MPGDQPANQVLDYAPPPPRAGRIIRRVTWWIFGLAVATFAIVWGWRFANQVHYLWLQHQLMTYQVPEGATVGPPAARILPRSYGEYVFIHERNARYGERRLVVVQAVGPTPMTLLSAESYVPASLSVDSRLLASGIWSDIVLNRTDRVTFHPGRVDPTDDSHFTIAFDTDRGSGIIDGWLMDDGSVKLEVRAGPLR